MHFLLVYPAYRQSYTFSNKNLQIHNLMFSWIEFVFDLSRSRLYNFIKNNFITTFFLLRLFFMVTHMEVTLWLWVWYGLLVVLGFFFPAMPVLQDILMI